MKIDISELPRLVCPACNVDMIRDDYRGKYECPNCWRSFRYELLRATILSDVFCVSDTDCAIGKVDNDKVVVEKAKLDEINAAIEKMIEYFEWLKENT